MKSEILDTQENVKSFNAKLEAFYRNPSYADVDKTVVDALINNMLKNEMENTIEKALSSDKYSIKRKQYAALKKIEKEVNKRAVVSERQNTRWLIDFTDFVSADLAVDGMMKVLWGNVVWWLSNVVRGT